MRKSVYDLSRCQGQGLAFPEIPKLLGNMLSFASVYALRPLFVILVSTMHVNYSTFPLSRHNFDVVSRINGAPHSLIAR